MHLLQALAVVLWKNLWVQPFRHHYISTAAEITILVLCFGVLWNRERPAPGTLRRSTDALVYSEEPALNETFLDKKHVLVYGPPVRYAKEIMSAFQPASIKQHSARAKGAPKPPKKMLYVAKDAAEVALMCADLRRQFHSQNQSVICIAFDQETLGTMLLNYTVHVTTHYKGDYSPGLKFPWTFRAPPKDIDVYDQVQKIMAVVETRHIELQTSSEFSYDDIQQVHVDPDEDVADSTGIKGPWSNKSNKHWPPENGEGIIVNVSVRRFPHPSMPDDADNYRASVSYILGIAFLLPFCMRLKEIVQDKETGMNELQMIMGLSSLESTLGHIITGVVLTFLQSLVPVFCMTVLSSGGPVTDQAYLQGANVTLLLFVFFMFSVMLSFHALLIAALFLNTSMAIMFGVFYWVILTLAVPLMIIDGPAPSLAHYIFTSESRKYYSSYTPCLGTYWMLKMIGIAVDFDGTAGWDIFSTFAFGMDSITIGYVVGTMAESFVLMLFLIWYLSVVLPWNSKKPRPFYFLLKISYWIPTEHNVNSAKSKYKRMHTHHEEPPPAAIVVASGRAVTMSHGALDSADFRILDKHITAILGHNAAGKTTILKTLAGLVHPSKGSVQVCGYDVATHTSQARQNISFCQQDDVSRAFPYSLIKQRVEEVLDDLSLTDIQHVLPCYLSGGVLKRLSVAIAVVSRPRLILLDEPTAGIDPENKGDVWDVLLDIGQTCAVVLSTHDLQEADVLADWITVIAHGRVLCSGSPTFIRKNFGPGYQLVITRSQAPYNSAEVMKIIKNTAPAAEVKDLRQDEVDIDLNVVGTEGLDVMFAALERASAWLGIESISVAATTMEELFVRINLSELSEKEKDAWLNKEDHVLTASSVVNAQPSLMRTMLALLVKRALCLSRSCVALALAWVAPFAIFWVMLIFEQSALDAVAPLCSPIASSCQ
ncbi:hypothetical protein MTO96_010036 [Rhipicephalus appendiculatus]